MPGVAADVTTAWLKKYAALRTNGSLDLTTAITRREPTVRGSVVSTSTDVTTRLRDYYAAGGTTY